jgi:hypothetical protein
MDIIFTIQQRYVDLYSDIALNYIVPYGMDLYKQSLTSILPALRRSTSTLGAMRNTGLKSRGGMCDKAEGMHGVSRELESRIDRARHDGGPSWPRLRHQSLLES